MVRRKIMAKFLIVSLAGFLSILMIMGLSYGEEKDYPTRPVTSLISSAPGGGTDVLLRILAGYFQESLRQPMVVVYKTGAGGVVCGESVVNAKPDGYTIGLLSLPAAIPEVFKYFQDAPYSSADLKPVCRIFDITGVLITKSDAPWNSLKDVVEYVRKNPGAKCGVMALGGSPMLTVIKVAKKENIKFTFVPHSGDIEVVRFVMGGHIPFGHVSYGSAKPHIEAGTLKALASFSEKRLESMPQVPTFAELGYDPGHYPSFGWYAPRDTPDSIIQKIYGVVQKASNTTAYIEKVRNLGFLPAFANSDQYQNDLKKYAIDIGNALKELGYVKN